MPLGASGAIDNGVLILVGVLCLVIVAISVWRRAQQRSALARDLTREQRARLRDQQEVRQSLEELLVQLDEVTTRINTQLDTRMTRLEAMLRLADERTGQPTEPAAAPAEAPPPAAPRVAADVGGRRWQRVYELADQGTSPIAIAEALQLPVGEVELVLDLRGYSKGGDGNPAGGDTPAHG